MNHLAFLWVFKGVSVFPALIACPTATFSDAICGSWLMFS